MEPTPPSLPSLPSLPSPATHPVNRAALHAAIDATAVLNPTTYGRGRECCGIGALVRASAAAPGYRDAEVGQYGTLAKRADYRDLALLPADQRRALERLLHTYGALPRTFYAALERMHFRVYYASGPDWAGPESQARQRAALHQIVDQLVTRVEQEPDVHPLLPTAGAPGTPGLDAHVPRWRAPRWRPPYRHLARVSTAVVTLSALVWLVVR